MNKRVAGVVLIILAVVGSALTFFGLNLLFSDLANMLMSSITIDIISSMPGFILSLDFILASIYVLRYVYRPQYRRRMTLTYLVILGVFSILGTVSCILSGAIVYSTILAPYPFKGYLVMCLVFHSLTLFFCIGGFYNAKKWMKPDPERRKMKVHYVIYTIVLSILICFAYYRFGAVLLSPLFIQWRTFYLTWPFYSAMILPIALLAHTVLYSFGVYTKWTKGGIIHAAILLVLSIGFSTVIILVGMNNTTFISSISPVLPLERLASMPIDTAVYVLLMVGFSTYELVYSIRYYKRHKD